MNEQKLLSMLEERPRVFWKKQFETGKASLIGSYIFHDKGVFRVVFDGGLISFKKERC